MYAAILFKQVLYTPQPRGLQKSCHQNEVKGQTKSQVHNENK